MNTNSPADTRAALVREIAALADLDSISSKEAVRATSWIRNLTDAQIREMDQSALSICDIADSIIHLSACAL